jgi:fatty acid-binding protein DegV
VLEIADIPFEEASNIFLINSSVRHGNNRYYDDDEKQKKKGVFNRIYNLGLY